MKQEKQLVLLFGATGKSGFHIANRLIQSLNYPVRIVVRSKEKTQNLFKLKQMAFQKIIQGDLSDQNTLKQAFKESDHFGKVKFVISSLGAAGFQSQSKIAKLQSTQLLKIIDKSRQNNIQKFILISAALMERPWHPITVILNSMVPNVYHYKAQTQNFLRKSGLKYIIVRPPQLRGDYQDKKCATGYDLGQGDKILSHISRKTLSQVVIHSLNAKQIPEKVTFQCKSNHHKIQCQPQNFSVLKSDTDKQIVKANHKLAKYTYWFVILCGFAAGTYFLFDKYIQGKDQQ